MSTACEGTAVQNHPDQAGIWFGLKVKHALLKIGNFLTYY
jgi:hypothetical protein